MVGLFFLIGTKVFVIFHKFIKCIPDQLDVYNIDDCNKATVILWTSETLSTCVPVAYLCRATDQTNGNDITF